MLNDGRLAELEAAIKIAPPLPTKPGKNDNWVERFGVRKPTGGKGLPPYIDRIARHLFHGNKARFPTVGAAVQTAVDKAKEWCATSTNPAVKAKACNAARQWMQMRARAGAARATKSMYPQAQKSLGHVDQFDLDFIELLGYETTPGFEVPVLTTAEERVLMDLAFVGEETLVPEEGDGEALAAEEDSEIGEGSIGVGSSPLTDPSSGDTREGESPELAGPIVVKSAAKQVAYAPVLVPGEKDADGEVYTEDKIQEVAWDFIANHRYMDEQHRLSGQVAVPVESYILQNDMQVEMAGKTETVPKGSWMMGARFPDAEVWRRVETDELEGFSITAVRRADYEAAVEKAKAEAGSVATKSSEALATDEMQVPTFRVKVSDLGDDWICPAVSVVRGPAVKKAKWIAKKSAPEESEGGAGDEVTGLFKNLARALGLTVEKSESESKEEELDVKITQAELDKKIEAAAEARIAALLAELEDDEDDLEDDEEDTEQQISFESEDDFQAYVQEQAEAAIIAAAEEDDEDEVEDETSEELVAVKSELTEVKKALVKLGALPKADKSQQIAGQGSGAGEGAKPFNMQEYLKRDAMGNYIGDKRAG